MTRIRLASVVLAVAALMTAFAITASASAEEPVLGYDHTVGESIGGAEGTAIDSAGNVWAAGRGGNSLWKFGPEGEFLAQTVIGPYPRDVRVDPSGNGNVWVTDEKYNKIMKFNSKGEEIGSVSNIGHLIVPYKFAIEPNGNFWIVDSAYRSAVNINSNGEFIREFSLPTGEGAGQFNFPAGIAIDAGGNLWITDHAVNGRVEKFSPGGKYLGQVGEGYLSQPEGDPAFDSNGHLWIPDTGHSRVAEFDTTSPKPPLQTLGEPGFGPGHLGEPASLAFGSDGSIWIGDSGAQHWTNQLSPRLSGMPVTEAFKGDAPSLANYNENWSKLGWATGKGEDLTTGWRPQSGYPAVSGAFFNPIIANTGLGTAVVVNMAASPGVAERYFSAWLDAPGSASAREGYELRFTYVSSSTYNVTLSKWVGGNQTVLASKSGYTFFTNSSFALVDLGSTISVWTKTGSEFTQLLSANDSTFSSGNAGIEGAGTNTRLTNFKAGQPPLVPHTIITGGSAGKVTPDVAFTFSSNESGSVFECAIDAGTFSICSSPKSYEALSAGPHTFKVRAWKGTLVDPTPAERTVEVKTTAEAVASVPVLDEFGRSEIPLANGKWTKTSWTEEIGSSWTSPWHGYGASESHLAGAYWNGASFSDASAGLLVSATVGTGSTASGEYMALRLDMPSPGSARSGYEARFTGTNGSASAYKVELSKWVSGTRTVLGTKEGFSLPVNTTFVLTETGGKLTLWTGTSSFSRVLTAYDATYSSGYAGIEVNKGEGTAYNFRAGKVQ
jgi:hypothetical protein